MMLKLKIYSTVLVLYEIVAVMLLHCPRTCDALFSGRFCNDMVYKYFIVCFAVPAILSLIFMWVMHIIHAIRRRNSLLYRAQTAVEDVAHSMKKTIRESISNKDLQKYVVAAVLAGVKKYSDYHPNMKKAIDNVIGAIGLSDAADGDEESNKSRPNSSRNNSRKRK